MNVRMDSSENGLVVDYRQGSANFEVEILLYRKAEK